MGKTAVFVLSILQQLDPKPGEVQAIVLCHTRELAFQVRNCEISRPPLPLSTPRLGRATSRMRAPCLFRPHGHADLPRVRALQHQAARRQNRQLLRGHAHHAAQGPAQEGDAQHRRRHARAHQAGARGTRASSSRGRRAREARSVRAPTRFFRAASRRARLSPARACPSNAQLAKEGALKLSTVKHFVLDECDKMLEKLGEQKAAAAPGQKGASALAQSRGVALKDNREAQRSLLPPRAPCAQTCALTSRRFSS